MSNHELPASYLDGQDDQAVFRAGRLITLSALMLAAFLAWAAWFEVTEVSTGTGKVIPSSREQVIQSFEGGIVAQMNVAEGDLVERGQVLAQLDPTKTASSVGESEAKYRAAKASQARLQAEVTGKPLTFPASLRDSPELIEAETALYQTRRRGLEQTLAGIEDSLRLVRSELKITENLAKMGASSRVEVIRLNRQRSELELKANEARSDYLVRAREELAKASAEADSLSEVIRGQRLAHPPDPAFAGARHRQGHRGEHPGRRGTARWPGDENRADGRAPADRNPHRPARHCLHPPRPGGQGQDQCL